MLKMLVHIENADYSRHRIKGDNYKQEIYGAEEEIDAMYRLVKLIPEYKDRIDILSNLLDEFNSAIETSYTRDMIQKTYPNISQQTHIVEQGIDKYLKLREQLDDLIIKFIQDCK